jgi:hypothetical protein
MSPRLAWSAERVLPHVAGAASMRFGLPLLTAVLRASREAGPPRRRP